MVTLEEQSAEAVYDPLRDYLGDNTETSALHECASKDWPNVLELLLKQAKRFHCNKPLSEVTTASLLFWCSVG